MTFHYLAFRAMCNATEDLERVKKAVCKCSGTSEVSVSRSKGYHGNPIDILEAKLKGTGKNLFLEMSSEDLKRLIEEAEERLDDEDFFRFRLDKQQAYLGELRLCQGKDCVDVRGKVKRFEKHASSPDLVKRFLEKVIKKKETQRD